jgi:hypothetical protein
MGGEHCRYAHALARARARVCVCVFLCVCARACVCRYSTARCQAHSTHTHTHTHTHTVHPPGPALLRTARPGPARPGPHVLTPCGAVQVPSGLGANGSIRSLSFFPAGIII